MMIRIPASYRAQDHLSVGSVASLDRSALSKLEHALERSSAVRSRQLVDRIISPYTMKDLSGSNDTLTAFYLVERDDEGRRILPVSNTDTAALRRAFWQIPP
jgi:hypothetical protein